jgi:hypothetical protein
MARPRKENQSGPLTCSGPVQKRVWPGYQACCTNIKAVEAWAAKPHAHLGRFHPKTTMVVHLRSMVE